MADYSMLGAFSSDGAASLNAELIEKLKQADSASVITPIEEDLEDITLEGEALELLKAQTNLFLETLTKFDLYEDENNVFDQFSADSSGSAGIFDAVNLEDLQEGTNYVEVEQLAQRDVYQTNAFEGDGDTVMPYGALEINGTVYSTSGMKYSGFVESINASDDVSATIVQVSDTESRLVIKSKDPGIDNGLTIKQSTDYDFGFSYQQTSDNIADVTATILSADETATIKVNGNEISIDDTMTYQDLANSIDALDNVTVANLADITAGTATEMTIEMDDGSSLNITEDGISLGYDSNQTMEAQNLKATVDGVDYDVSSNTIDVQGSLTFTATQTGPATISIQKDTSVISPAIDEFVEQYNTFISTLENELSNTESFIEDRGTIRMIISQVKELIFDNYGSDGDKNIFNYGFELDKTGKLSVDKDKIGEYLQDNLDDIKELFVGTAENPGLGTQLNELIDDLDGYNGLFTKYKEGMDNREEELEERLEKAQETLDARYEQMAKQFSSYAAIISQMESSFSGIKMMIEMETSGN